MSAVDTFRNSSLFQSRTEIAHRTPTLLRFSVLGFSGAQVLRFSRVQAARSGDGGGRAERCFERPGGRRRRSQQRRRRRPGDRQRRYGRSHSAVASTGAGDRRAASASASEARHGRHRPAWSRSEHGAKHKVISVIGGLGWIVNRSPDQDRGPTGRGRGRSGGRLPADARRGLPPRPLRQRGH